jgi:hypothetical protein
MIVLFFFVLLLLFVILTIHLAIKFWNPHDELPAFYLAMLISALYTIALSWGVTTMSLFSAVEIIEAIKMSTVAIGIPAFIWWIAYQRTHNWPMVPPL